MLQNNPEGTMHIENSRIVMNSIGWGGSLNRGTLTSNEMIIETTGAEGNGDLSVTAYRNEGGVAELTGGRLQTEIVNGIVGHAVVSLASRKNNIK
jgi:hypothetical protein